MHPRKTVAVPASAMEAERELGVLVVDADPFTREAAGRVLRDAGYSVLFARSAREARGHMDYCGDLIDVLVTAVRLPDDDGAALAGQMLSANPTLCVAFTGEHESVAGEVEGALDAWPFVVHSAVQDELVDVLRFMAAIPRENVLFLCPMSTTMLLSVSGASPRGRGAALRFGPVVH